ncbi:hypothetical protein O181_107552 [Austropuccinia psidii MF-1]|uniref:Integrase catalytic domain-containing protein n=1 Tax=Austropuccinia psidii MF-1 TaxID=1389203 RepID=A0A9Q3JSI6_9BASI|nr:hypothetical protein [Austropuccinia psidii MF-1]
MPYEHHQNGIIERTNRTISEMARTCNLNTPFERLGKKKPQLEMLCVFGAKSYLYEHNFRKNFSPRVTVGYHLGVSEDLKGWLIWVPEKKKVMKAASVVFDESTFFTDNRQVGGALNSIQVRNLFDTSMIDEFNWQDKSLLISTSDANLHVSIPSDYKEAMVSIDKVHWNAAIYEEIGSMRDENVFETIDLKEALKEVPHQSILSTKWVFTKKPDCYKARLVARGFRQIHWINYDETFAPTPTFSSLRLLFSDAALKRWSIRTFDVKVAFLHSLIDKPVYLWPPMGMEIPKFKVLKLRKALYGTRQAARCWWMHLKNILLKIGFKSNGEDPSTYTLDHNGEQVILWIHVDDGALTASSVNLINWISNQLNEYLKIKWDERIKGLVGISNNETDEGFKFSQHELIEKIINLSPSNIISKSPLPTNCQLESNFSCRNMDKPYLKRIGMLLYVAQASRPDIAYAVNYLARFSLSTDDSHWEAMNHLIAYLQNTKNMGIVISKKNKSLEMNCFVDANWGGEGNRSTHGYLVMHGMNPIAWQSKRQTTIASSTAQA